MASRYNKSPLYGDEINCRRLYIFKAAGAQESPSLFKADLRDEGSGGRSLLESTIFKPAEKFVDFPIVPRPRQIGYDTKGN